MKEENKKIFYVEYKDGGGFGCAEEVEVYESEILHGFNSRSGEKIAVMKVQEMLLDDYDYMSRLLDVYEITPKVAIHDDDEDDGQWRIKDGPVLDQDSQDALNDAMLNMVNEDGMTLKQVWDKEIEDNKKK